MCDTCGCPTDASEPAKEISLGRDILSLNNEIAGEVRRYLAAKGILCLNIISAPGSGKTSFLERVGREYQEELSMAVIVGDQQTDNDQQRLHRSGLAAVQINTGAACHLDARMVQRAIKGMDLSATKVLFIENIGNMVCPTAYDLGEDLRVAMVSTPEGADKPAKYPDLILTADLLLINKIDLLPYVDFNLTQCCSQARQLKPGLEIFPLSASTGAGLAPFWHWLRERTQAKAAPDYRPAAERSRG
ncbi:MAG: hydrogenase nickel incorporation protein HypB [Desulfurivibrionaceae bacterium]|nr:hydrogenase nickel incorporation protein HypB [Desulfurivibrionaceae bacterium]